LRGSQSTTLPPHPPEQHGERLQKYLARAGIASRRHAEELIEMGVVSVNGAVIRELGTRVDPDTDEVRVRGRVVRLPRAAPLYILLNKPRETVTTAHDPQGRRTVLDLLPAEWVARRVYPVGRLDRETEGVLLLTDDGEMALRLTHPRYALPKEYLVVVAGRPSREALAQLRAGVDLPDEERPTAPARVRVVRSNTETSELSIELHEGRNRQVRRMCDAVGHPVRSLRRVRVGPLTVDGLAPGASRLLSPAEVALLHRVVGLA
jgi:pseudouridine synthase